MDPGSCLLELLDPTLVTIELGAQETSKAQGLRFQ